MVKQFLKMASALIPIIICSSAFATDMQASMSKAQIDETSKLVPNLQNGRKVFHTCALCHSPEGWGTNDGSTPEIAGQHSSVIIKQLTDIRMGNRDNPTMIPFTTWAVMNKQDIVDIAAYVEQLKMAPSNLMGPGDNLEHGKKVYEKECAECHGANGEGNAKEFYPKIHGQNYNYLLRQMYWIKDGKRRNANRKMVKQIERFTDEDMIAVIDYSSRLRPTKDEVAPNGWINPDFSRDFKFSPKYQIKGR